MMRKPLLKPLIVGLWLLAFAAIAWVGFLAPKGNSLSSDDLGRGAYRLTTHDGKPFTEASLRGEPSLVFFGFTHCPDVCPTTLGDIADWRDALGEDDKPRIFLVTVDPERDAPADLAEYVGWLPGALGVTGSRAEIDAALRAFRIYATKPPPSGGDYNIDHSSSILMFGADGRFKGTIAYQSPAAEAVRKLRDLTAGA